jgi:hypothetical protein
VKRLTRSRLSSIYSVEELKSFSAAGSVNLVHLVDIDIWLKYSTDPSDDLHELKRKLVKQFEQKEDHKITGSSTFTSFRAGVIRTDSGRIYTYYDSQHPGLPQKVERLLWDMEGFSEETEQLLESGRRKGNSRPSTDRDSGPLLPSEGEEKQAGSEEETARNSIGRRLYELTLHLQHAVDESSGRGDTQVRQAIELVTEEFDSTMKFRDRVALRVAQSQYLKGVLLGLLVMSGLLLLVAGILYGTVTLTALNVDTSLMQAGLTAVVGGALGAAVSVLQRLTAGNLKLDFYAGQRTLRRVGSARPLVGASFALFLFAAVESGMLSIGPDESSTQGLFYGALGFISGFNERWAQDMLSRSSGSVGGST